MQINIISTIHKMEIDFILIPMQDFFTQSKNYMYLTCNKLQKLKSRYFFFPVIYINKDVEVGYMKHKLHYKVLPLFIIKFSLISYCLVGDQSLYSCYPLLYIFWGVTLKVKIDAWTHCTKLTSRKQNHIS